MNKRVFGRFGRFGASGPAALAVCAILFSGGAIAGVFFSRCVGGADPAAAYVRGLAETAASGENVLPGLGVLIPGELVFPALAFAFGFSALGTALVPLLSAARGLALAFSVSLVVRVLGKEGVAFALALFAPDALASLPCFFILSVQSLGASSRLFSAASRPEQFPGGKVFGRCYFGRAAVCLFVPSLLAVCDKYLLFHLVCAAARHI